MAEATEADSALSTQPSQLCDVTNLTRYLRRAVPTLLDDSEEGDNAADSAFAKCLSDRVSQESLRKFIADPQSPALLIQKEIQKDELEESQEEGGCQFTITTDFHFTKSRVSAVVLVKRGAVIEAEKRLVSQVQLVNFSEEGGTPYATLHTLVSRAVAPYFKSYARKDAQAGGASKSAASGAELQAGDKMAPAVEKKLEELELGLLHLQQNIEIPEITIQPHPYVAQILSECVKAARKARVADFEDRMNDAAFLNALQSGVNKWIREIQKVTRLDRDPSSGTALQEIAFWLNLERALHRIQEKRDGIEITLTLDILKQAKRFHATVSFDADTGLRTAIETVADYNTLFKDFPLNELLSATELDKLRAAVQAVFVHLKKIRNTKYPLVRCMKLVEAISRDLLAQLLKVLGTRRLMSIGFDEFDALCAQANEVFAKWEDEFDKLQQQLRELGKKKREEYKLYRPVIAHKKLEARLEHVRRFRNQHEQLRTVILRVLKPDAGAGVSSDTKPDGAQAGSGSDSAAGEGEASSIDEVNAAYELVREVDCLDVSKEGHDAWEAAVKRYDDRVNRIETRITTLLRRQLAAAKSANEMFRIFSRFNALFVRAHIRAAIREYQTQLIQRVKEDIEELHERFKRGYAGSNEELISRMRDIPPVSGHIIWAKMIERKLDTYLKRVEDVLGKSWEQHLDGQKLKADGDNFRAKLSTHELFEDWLKRVQSRPLQTEGRIFTTESVRVKVTVELAAPKRAPGAGSADETPRFVTQVRLRVNFSVESITLAKEVRNMKWLGFRLPLTVVNKAHQANNVYPYAISLIESLRAYEAASSRIDDPNAALNSALAAATGAPASQASPAHLRSASQPCAFMSTLSILCAGMKRDIHALIAEGVALTWESYKLEQFVQRFSEKVLEYTDRVDELLDVARRIEQSVRTLELCAYSNTSFAEVLTTVQRYVDDLSLKQYSNLACWVQQIDEEIGKRLVVRLDAAVREWTRALRGEAGGRDDEDDGESLRTSAKQDGDDATRSCTKLGGEPRIAPIVHELRIVNQLIHVTPCLEEARTNLFAQFGDWVATVTALRRVEHSRYRAMNVQADGGEKQADVNYTRLLTRLPNTGESLNGAYAAIMETVRVAEQYVATWLNYQNLWDLQAEQIYAKLGTSLRNWMTILDDIRTMRKHFDTSETHKEFGPLCIQFAKVQSKVSLKYDAWHKEVLAKFGSLLASEMSTFHARVAKSRTELEHANLELATTGEAVALITFVQRLKREQKRWRNKVEAYRDGQRILERQRFQFPNGWLYADNVQGEYGAFNDILQRKDTQIQSQVASLQMKVVNEDRLVEARTTELLAEWDREKPVHGGLRPDAALKLLNIVEGKFQRVREERGNVQRAKEALELVEPGARSPSEQRIESASEELRDLKSVWLELAKVWNELDTLRDTSWTSLQPRAVRKQLDTLLNTLKEMPSRLRSYAQYEHCKRTVQNLARMNVLISELKSDAVKDRHWRTLTRKLNVAWQLAELTLGQLWDADLVKHETSVREVLAVAQGERALEEFLRQVADCWRAYQLELVNYQNRTRLIRGWDELFNQIKEHLNSLAAMKLSPYYKQFEEEAVGWDEKLNRISALFDVWIDVQRRWVYLDGIFSGSVEIKTLLPVESQRFGGVSSEFLALLKRVAKAPLVLEVLGIANIQKQLERFADLLQKIQKALGEYLEKERAAFPRFYFVGDEDLLEIIGNSRNYARLQKHFKKMFAGVQQLELAEDESIVTALVSRENERVQLVEPVRLVDRRINEWLSDVEAAMKSSLCTYLERSIERLRTMLRAASITEPQLFAWIDEFPTQLVTLAFQLVCTDEFETALALAAKDAKPDTARTAEALSRVVDLFERIITLLANAVVRDQPAIRRKKLEHLVTELVHQRDVARELVHCNQESKVPLGPRSFDWLRQMRFYWNAAAAKPAERLRIEMANANFFYGFEYLGIQERLVQTRLTDRCYLTMTQALEARLGGSPFGPAGTGKTETVKALGQQLGRFVLVFNCDESFDFQAMGRIFVGLCQVGAWGCFDEFNRLEERMLSACSQQIQTIQEALRDFAKASKSDPPITVELVGKQVHVHPDMAIFITMNPGYAGRSNLPDNLKKLFRSLAMVQPDRQMIAQIMLFSQGFRTAERLARKVVPFFRLCAEQLSPQSHYDFGLRALKSVLVSAGNIKREKMLQVNVQEDSDSQPQPQPQSQDDVEEQKIVIQSLRETMIPKLVKDDIELLQSLLNDVFPGVPYEPAEMTELRNAIRSVCAEQHYSCSDTAGEPGAAWLDKVLQLYQITQIHHGVMMVGPTGSGKSIAWRTLLRALELVGDKQEGVAHVIDPKSISKDALYGQLDANTREWQDGLFTHILRKIIDSVRGEASKRHWIIFDGDVDPEWCENMNSVLDDNKLLTLPNGERLAIPPNVRIMFEVQDLRYATLATVSRCGMVFFSDETLTPAMLFQHYLARLSNVSLDDSDEAAADQPLSGLTKPSALTDSVLAESQHADAPGTASFVSKESAATSPALLLQRDVAAILHPYFDAVHGLVVRALEYAANLEHIMDFTRMRALNALFSMLNKAVRNVFAYNHGHPDMPMRSDQMEKYVRKYLVYSLLWSFAGDAKLKARHELGEFIRNVPMLDIDLPPKAPNMAIIDYEVTINGEWTPWSAKVPQIEIETHRITSPDVVVPTLDTIRHESLLYTWLAEHRPVVLCGPPGSGKTMTLFSALRALPDLEVVGLNFSSATTPELMLKTLDHCCEYRKTPNGIVLAPVQMNKWLVLFCDEINLPDQDKYGTQRVISFLRQFVEHGGFYRSSDQQFVRYERIQFVGACNPPTDPGRKPLSHRFLRHVPVVYVDYPGASSLKQIYGTFNRAMLRLTGSLRAFAEPLTDAMCEVYTRCQEHFTHELQPHYVYSPREMTRWVRGLYEALRPLGSFSLEGLVRIWAHEAIRLFVDRLVTPEEREQTEKWIDEAAGRHFPNANVEEALRRPILFSNWLSKEYVPVKQSELADYVRARLKVFCEEELDVPLVLFNDVLDHVLRIDRVFRQSQGHMLLIGVSGAGKTTLARFVAWLNGLSVFQIKAHNRYTGENFDEDLRTVLRRAGCRGERIAFIMDESNILSAAFLERMNTLLANGEVPGLFEGDEYAALMTQCKEGAVRENVLLDSAEDLYRWFTTQVCRNLHVVFTMNPSADGLKSRAATSPALFNRCVLNWFGDWPTDAFYQVGRQLTSRIDLDRVDYVGLNDDSVPHVPLFAEPTVMSRPVSHRDAVVNSFVFVHLSLHAANRRVAKRGGRTMAITPRHYLDFIQQYVKLFGEKRAELEEQQLHLNVGLSKIRETVAQVETLGRSLATKRAQLAEKQALSEQTIQKMVEKQNEAEQRKREATELRRALQDQERLITTKKQAVINELAGVEPALAEAKQAVGSIKKQHLVEVKSLPNPPSGVKLAVEAICTLLGETDLDWKSLRQVITRDGFIQSILTFQTEQITSDIKSTMQRKYLANPDFTYEKVNKASVACGPFVKWLMAQIGYADMLQNIEPLRNELGSLETQMRSNQERTERVEAELRQLEAAIARFKEEYAELVRQTEAIRAELCVVEKKVTRSVALIDSLSTERQRWEAGSEVFKQQMATIVGDVLLSAGFMAYAGYYDQSMRKLLFDEWALHLAASHIQFRAELARVEYLCSADERLKWQSHALPTDELCVENAIILKRFNRYPLVIDPSGQATEFLLNLYRDRKVAKTSFLDDAFRKQLESALRFGTPLLVQDVENYDAILNPVLNNEVRRTGGRVLITIGDQDIDLSPSFAIFLTTRDPTVEFPPDLCSRVTFVNFTVTRSSLQNQCLNAVLKAERGDVDAKRTDLLRLQGEFQLRLRQLEKALLSALNEAKGNILDDDSILTQLEALKREAHEVASKAEETELVMRQVESVSAQYAPLARFCSAIYFTLESLNQIHFLYQFSLQFFVEIFNAVLYSNRNLDGVRDHAERLRIITNDLFESTYTRVKRSVLNADHITLAFLLARIRLRGEAPASTFDAEFGYLLRAANASDVVVDKDSISEAANRLTFLTTEQRAALARLARRLPQFRTLTDAVTAAPAEFQRWIDTATPEVSVPELWNKQQPAAITAAANAKQLEAVGVALNRLVLVQTFRPDRLLAAARQFVAAVLGEHFAHLDKRETVLREVIDGELRAQTPALLCTVVGYDASSRVEDLAAETDSQLFAVAIGSAEGFAEADRAIATGSKQGRWVLLKNVHLAPAWLLQLEKKLHSLQPHPNFRLFLTMEINPKVPVNLLRAGRIFVFEPPPGVRSSLLRTFDTQIGATRAARPPGERTRLYFLLAWLHAVVLERLRYTPLGWSKRYEFNEADLRSALDTIDSWLDAAALGRTNLPPERIPFDALRTLLSECIYGGRIDNEFDHRLLQTFVNKLFDVHAFEREFALVSNVDSAGFAANRIACPDAIRREDFLTWVGSLVQTQTPSWLGLPNNAEKVLLTDLGYEMCVKILKMYHSDDDEGLSATSMIAGSGTDKQRSLMAPGAGEHQQQAVDHRPAWMRALLESIAGWLGVLPKSLTTLKRTSENLKDPLFRCFEREVNMAIHLLDDVRRDLGELEQVGSGARKPTNLHRSLMEDLARGVVPTAWRRYTVAASVTVGTWVADLADRLRQLETVAQTFLSGGTASLKNTRVWLGGLFMSEAYLTATRQFVAQQSGWSLEELVLEVTVYSDASKLPATFDRGCFAVTGLRLQGATCQNGNQLALTDSIFSELQVTVLKWTRQADRRPSNKVVLVPVYLNATRAQLLFTLEFECDPQSSISDITFYERGVAVIATHIV